jgi:hypothetical protein
MRIFKRQRKVQSLKAPQLPECLHGARVSPAGSVITFENTDDTDFIAKWVVYHAYHRVLNHGCTDLSIFSDLPQHVQGSLYELVSQKAAEIPSLRLRSVNASASPLQKFHITFRFDKATQPCTT